MRYTDGPAGRFSWSGLPVDGTIYTCSVEAQMAGEGSSWYTAPSYEKTFINGSDIEPEDYTLTVNSNNPFSGVSMSSNSGHSGEISYTRTVEQGVSVNLTALQHVGSGESRKSFSSWSGDEPSSNRTINFTMSGNRKVTANYVDDPEQTEDEGVLYASFGSGVSWTYEDGWSSSRLTGTEATALAYS